MLRPPLVFKTYQDVKNNLVYWTVVLLAISTLVIYLSLLDDVQKKAVNDFVTSLGTNSLVATVAGIAILGLYSVLAVILIWGIQVHDKVYDKYIVRWRQRYDVQFILLRLTGPMRDDLPKGFLDLAACHRYEFMKPFYEFTGDRKEGIEQNTRIRFYERITWYWVTQMNEIFILLFLVGVPVYALVSSVEPLSAEGLAGYTLVLVTLGIANRGLMRIARNATSQVTLDEIEEILSDPENIERIRSRYVELCEAYS